MVNQNSTFAELSVLDKAAVAIPHYLYATGVDKDTTAFILLGVWATILVFVGAYVTIQQPKAAIDPNEDKDSPLWDPTDRDGSPFLLKEPEGAASGNLQTLNWQHAVLLPVFSAGALYALDYVIRNWDLLQLALINGYFLLVLFLAAFGLLIMLSSIAARNVSYWFGLKGNSAFFIKRTRMTFSDENSLPLGVYSRIDSKSMDFSKEKLEEFEEFMWTENNAQLVRLPKLKSKDQEFALVYDSRWKWALLFALAFLGTYFNHNPALKSGYDLPVTNWLVNNMVASVLAINGCALIRVGNVKVAGILLLGLFFYDIYFVFKSHLMMSVATGLDMPGKLLFPRGSESLYTFSQFAGLTHRELLLPSSLLGLGDIMMPGFFIALCLRFDYHLFYSKNKLAFHKLRSIGVPTYFTAAMVGYVAALAATMTAVFVFDKGQPALLYIVPGILGAVALTALAKGEFGELWRYREELVKYQPKKEEKKKSKKTKSENEKKPEKVEELLFEFGDATDDSDDTFLIEDSTDADDDSDISDLEAELGHLIQDQGIEVEMITEELLEDELD